MIKSMHASLAIFLTFCGAGTALAADYDYEVTLDYGSGSSDTTSVSTLNGIPDPSLGTAITSSDNDEFGLAGTWYYSGVSDAKGPKSRAAFLDRASSVSFGYSRDETSGSIFFGGGPLPPIEASTKLSSNAISLNLRHVWRGSGWYMLAGVASAEAKFRVVDDGNASEKLDASQYSLGFGKYLGKQTAIELTVSEADTRGFDASNIALSLTHIGAVGSTWQYAVDLGIAKSDESGDDGSYTLRGSLFPSPDFEFGLGFSRQSGAFSGERDSVEGFADWFVSDNVALFGKYLEDITDEPPGTSSDSSFVGVGVKVRF